MEGGYDKLEKLEIIINGLEIYYKYLEDEKNNKFEPYVKRDPFEGLYRIDKSLVNGLIIYKIEYWWYSRNIIFEFCEFEDSRYRLYSILDKSYEKMDRVFEGEAEVYEFIKNYSKLDY